MSMGQFVRAETSRGIRFRWFTCNCTEVRLPNGKYIVFDPFLVDPKDEKFGKDWSCGYTPADLEGADYIIINHTHFDHILQLKEVYERFDHPRILCHINIAIYLAGCFGIDERDIFPFESHDTYNFGDFILETSEERHTLYPVPRPPVDMSKPTTLDFLGAYGWMLNTNFLLRLPDGETIGFCAGEWDTIARNRWRDIHPNILFRQRTNWKMTPAALAQEILDVGCQTAIPLHHNNAYDLRYDYDFCEFTAQVNDELKKFGSNTVFLNPERGKWYGASLTVKML